MQKERINIRDNYIIKITSNQDLPTGTDSLETIYTGDYVDLADKKYIVYREYNEGHPKNYTLCVMKVEKNNIITLTRNTKHQTKIIFEKGVGHYSPYCTDFGVITMCAYTHNIENNLSADGGNLNIRYSLSVNSNFISLTEISVEIKKK